MTAICRAIARFALRAIGIVKLIAILKAVKEVAAAKIIEFYVPRTFQRQLKWVPKLQRGKLIEFYPRTRKSA